MSKTTPRIAQADAGAKSGEIIRLADQQSTRTRAVIAARLATRNLGIVSSGSIDLADRYSAIRRNCANMTAATAQIRSSLKELVADLAELRAALEAA